MKSWGIHWFRRDLRVAGNAALQWSWKEHQGRVVGLFCFDSKFLARSDFSHNRFAFFMDSLLELKEELESVGSELWVIDSLPGEGFLEIFKALKSKSKGFSTVSFNRDYEPFARERDAKVSEFLQETIGIGVHTERDHLLIEPGEIIKPGDSVSRYYQVYTPYSRRWFDYLKSDEVQGRLKAQGKGLKYLSARSQGKVEGSLFKLKWKDIWAEHKPPFQDSLEDFRAKNKTQVTIKIPKAGSLEAYIKLKAFKRHLDAYGDQRDIPGIDGTSRLSIFLKNGSLTTGQVVEELGLGTADVRSGDGRTKFLKELVWREFYYSILFHKPRVEQGAFLEKYQNIKWENDKELFDHWKEGRTGYPIIDAGMRQLRQEGWMHNRVRMIVASFLTKDLLIDWRWGERHFMKELLDGDLAPNNGGWQWAASTGCDPQPYFRIFNPELQSLRFDPEGNYIRKYVPELARLTAKQIHTPSQMGQIALERLGYPAPIVNHAQQKPKALALFKS